MKCTQRCNGGTELLTELIIPLAVILSPTQAAANMRKAVIWSTDSETDAYWQIVTLTLLSNKQVINFQTSFHHVFSSEHKTTLNDNTAHVCKCPFTAFVLQFHY